LGPGFRVQDLGRRVFGSPISGFRVRISGLGVRGADLSGALCGVAARARRRLHLLLHHAPHPLLELEPLASFLKKRLQFPMGGREARGRAANIYIKAFKLNNQLSAGSTSFLTMSRNRSCLWSALKVSGFGFRVSGFGFRVSGFSFGFQFSGFGFKVYARQPAEAKSSGRMRFSHLYCQGLKTRPPPRYKSAGLPKRPNPCTMSSPGDFSPGKMQNRQATPRAPKNQKSVYFEVMAAEVNIA
jgi:hypothetical protein